MAKIPANTPTAELRLPALPGTSFVERTLYQAIGIRDPIPALPSLTGANPLTYNHATNTFTNAGKWTLAFPMYDPQAQKVMKFVALCTTDNTVVRLSAVISDQDNEDINFVFVRTNADLSNVAESKGNVRIPTDYAWEDNEPTGTQQLWSRLVVRIRGETQWTYRAPFRIGGEDGTSFKPITIYHTKNIGANDPQIPSNIAYDFESDVLSNGGQWTIAFPNYTEDVQVVVCATSTVSSKNVLSPWSSVRICEDPGSLSQVYQRVAANARPPTIPRTSSDKTPGSWTESVPGGTGILYSSVRHRAPHAVQWTFDTPITPEGQDGEPGKPGRDGVGAVERTLYQKFGIREPVPEHPETGGSNPLTYDYATDTFTNAENWTTTEPDFDPFSEKVACFKVFCTTNNQILQLFPVIECSDVVDTNITWRRTKDDLSNAPAEVLSVRIGPNDNDDVPDGTEPLWGRQVYRRKGQTTWTHSKYFRIEGADGVKGGEGVPGFNVQYPYRRNIRGTSRPVVSGDYKLTAANSPASSGIYQFKDLANVNYLWFHAPEGIVGTQATLEWIRDVSNRLQEGTIITLFVDAEKWASFRVTQATLNNGLMRITVTYLPPFSAGEGASFLADERMFLSVNISAAEETPSQRIGTPSGLSLTPGNRRLTATWTDGDGASSSNIRWRVSGGGYTTRTNVSSPYQITSVQGGALYEVEVQHPASGGRGASIWASTTGIPNGAPNTPSRPIMSQSGQALNIAVNALPGDDVKYEFQISRSSSFTSPMNSGQVDNENYSFPGPLAAGTWYGRARSVFGSSRSGYSALASIVYTVDAPKIPTPTGYRNVSITDTTASISWTSAETQFRVRVYRGATLVSNILTNNTFASFTSLEDDSDHRVEIIAIRNNVESTALEGTFRTLKEVSRIPQFDLGEFADFMGSTRNHRTNTITVSNVEDDTDARIDVSGSFGRWIDYYVLNGTLTFITTASVTFQVSNGDTIALGVSGTQSVTGTSITMKLTITGVSDSATYRRQ